MNIESAQAMADLGTRLADRLRAGDVVVLSGELGAGKTTLVQGIARGLGISDRVTSPTFVIARVYRREGGPSLVHADAYRLGSSLELEDIDVDAELDSAITIVEWGRGKIEALAPERLELHIDVLGDDSRMVSAEAVGSRWADFDLDALGSG
jgi:tRNA threonylcarbamoyladenosine biosynthesis protein TsaE